MGQLVDDDAGIGFIDVDRHLLDRLEPLAAVRLVPEDHPRPADRQLEPFAPHGLDQDAELQLAAPGDVEAVLGRALGNPERHVAFCFTHQPGADHPAGDLVALGSGQG